MKGKDEHSAYGGYDLLSLYSNQYKWLFNVVALCPSSNRVSLRTSALRTDVEVKFRLHVCC